MTECLFLPMIMILLMGNLICGDDLLDKPIREELTSHLVPDPREPSRSVKLPNYDRAKRRQNHDAVLKIEKEATEINQWNDDRVTPLIVAVKMGRVEEVERLLAEGAWRERPDRKFGRTPMLWALAGKNGVMVDLLFRLGAGGTAVDSEGESALDYAVKSGRLDLLKRIVENGVNPFESREGRPSALVLSEKLGHKEMVGYLNNFSQRVSKCSWSTDYDEGYALAEKAKVPLLLYFSGSNWCTNCRLIENHVFSTMIFKAELSGRVQPIQLDFDKSGDVPAEVIAYRRSVRMKYDEGRGVPKIVMALPDGTVISKTSGIRSFGQELWLDWFRESLGEAEMMLAGSKKGSE